MTAGRGFPQLPDAATMTTSPRLIVRLPIGRVELGHRLDPAQSLSLAAWVKMSDLNGHASTNRGQTRIGDDNSQFTQAPLAPSLPHLSHAFGRGGHLVSLPRLKGSVTRYAAKTQGNDPALELPDRHGVLRRTMGHGPRRLQRFHLDLRLSTAFYDGFVMKIRYWLVEAVRRSAPYLPA